MTADSPDSAPLADAVKATWHRFLDVYEPFRPDLYRYCRYLTRSPWDAEDLAQDTIARAFVTLGCMFQNVERPRAWLLRIASNLWIDRVRRPREQQDLPPEPATTDPEPLDRDAAGRLIARLSPQERAAVVLKDVFDLTLEEIAEALSTTAGAVKAALHRGRGRLQAPEPENPRTARPAVLDAFCAAFQARDLDRLTALLLETATVEVVGVTMLYGRDSARAVFHGMLFGSARMSGQDPRGGMDPVHRHGVLPEVPRLEARQHRGEWLLLSWYAHRDGEAVRAVTRVAADAEGLARVQNYFYTPDFLDELCRELAVPCRTNGYGYW